MRQLDAFVPHAHWLLRAALASVFLFHGIGKFMDLAGTAEMMGGMPMAVLAAVMETAGGALVFIGGLGNDMLTRLGGLLIAPVMGGAIAMVHWGQWSFAPSETHPMGGMEFQVTLLFIALYFFIVGNTTAEVAGDPSPAYETSNG
ncbi:MAG: DoxX family membrane protein [Bacteroidetes bacterium]|jgi:putative oxidoreductase|nr:DoxX family membrane protein [Bacteroidota bacterium]